MPEPSSTAPAGPEVVLGDDSPRGRLLTGMADAIAEKGFPSVTVADVVRHARTSRRTFYEHFDSREACFVAVLHVINNQLITHIAGAVDRSAPWRDQVRQAIEAWLEGSTVRPELTLAWIRDSPALPSARAVQVEAQDRFIALIGELADSPRFRDGHGPVSTELAVILVGGLRELIAAQVEAGRPLADLVEVATAATVALLNTA